MKQLSTTDGQLLHVESANAPEHIGILLIVDQSHAENGTVRFKDILRHFETRLDRSMIYTHKLAQVPLDIDQPYLVPDTHFDLEYHLRHIALPQPGDWRQLCIQVARLHSQGLDLSRPLWQCYIVEGLNNVENAPENSFAVYLKIHHSVADGMALLNFMLATLDTKPVLPEGEYGSIISKWDVPKEPNPISLLANSYRNWLRLPFDIFSTTTGMLPEYLRGRRFKQEHEYDGPPSKPMTRFDRPVSRNRVFNGVFLKIAELQQIRKAAPGSTLNDVAVAIISLALRKYLKSKQALPEKSLVGWIPVNIRQQDKAGETGNAFVTISATIHTDIGDPNKLLNAVANTNKAAKAYREDVGEELVTKITQVVPAPLQRLMGNLSYLGAKLGTSLVPANVSISNVPGHKDTLYFAGNPVVRIQGMGLLQETHGLFHAITSYRDEFMISFIACREQIPDPQFYTECIEEAFAELKAIAPKVKKSAAA